MKRKNALYALGAMIFLGASLAIFIVAAEEQTIISTGLAAAEKISLQELIAKGLVKNKHVELLDFYFGRQYIYATKMVEFKDVYLPVFATGQPETAGNLRLLIWIRNDRNSNEPLVQTQQDVDRFVKEINGHPRSISGILRKPTDRVQKLAADAYPGLTNRSLQVLWARQFPDQSSANILWCILVLCLAIAIGCGIAYRRESRL